MARIEELQAENETLRAQLVAGRIGDAFNRSRFVAEKLAIPPDIAQARFGGALSLEGGRLVATDSYGGRIMSRARLGEEAAFDEALEMLVDAYPNRDAIMRRAGGTITREVWDKLPPLEKREALMTRKLTLVD